MTDSQLGTDLLALRGVQWIMGTKDDPYALLLRAASDDPLELGRRIRERGPLWWSHAEAWVTGSFSVGVEMLAHPDVSPRHPDARAAAEEPPAPAREPMPWEFPALRDVLPLSAAFVDLDGRDYQRLERHAGRMLEHTTARSADRRAEAYDRAAAALPERFDVVADFARPAVSGLVGEELGHGGDSRFAEWSAGAAGLLDATVCPPQLAAARRMLNSVDALRDLLAASGSGTLATSLTTARVPPEDHLAVSMLVATVGVEVTVDLVTAAVAVLLDHPTWWKQLRAASELAPTVVEETLRFAPPVRLHRCHAQRDLTLAGQDVGRGQEMVVVTLAANRDPRTITEPDVFDPGRERPIPHLSLTSGGPVGVLAPLVRTHATAALRALAARWTTLRPGAERPLRRLRSPLSSAMFRLPAVGG